MAQKQKGVDDAMIEAQKVFSVARVPIGFDLSNLSKMEHLRSSSRQLAPYDSYAILRPLRGKR
jgi:hypothetical protein